MQDINRDYKVDHMFLSHYIGYWLHIYQLGLYDHKMTPDYSKNK